MNVCGFAWDKNSVSEGKTDWLRFAVAFASVLPEAVPKAVLPPDHLMRLARPVDSVPPSSFPNSLTIIQVEEVSRTAGQRPWMELKGGLAARRQPSNERNEY